MVTSQCHMQIGGRHDQPASSNQSGTGNAVPLVAGGDRQRPRHWGRRACPGAPRAPLPRPRPKLVGTHLQPERRGRQSGAAGRAGRRAGCAEVVVRRGVPGWPAAHWPGCIPGAGRGGGGASGRMLGAAALAAGLGVFAAAAAELTAQIGTFKQLIVTSQRGQPATRHRPAERRPIPG